MGPFTLHPLGRGARFAGSWGGFTVCTPIWMRARLRAQDLPRWDSRGPTSGPQEALRP
jgi:hypothetical protein